MGATRNIVVRNGTSKGLNEAGIREDLEHIHNLVVISVVIRKSDIFISTNSIHNALFARTCMMSRSLYKGLKIDWFEDESAGSIPRMPERAPAPVPNAYANVGSKKPQSQPLSNNLFALLDMDGDEDDGSDKSSDDDSQARPGYSGGVKINWADAMTAV